MGLLRNGIYGMGVGLAGILGGGKRVQPSPVSFARSYGSRYVSMPVGYYDKALVLPLSYGGICMRAPGTGSASADIKAEAKPSAILAGSAEVAAHVTGLKNSPATLVGVGSIVAPIKGKTALACEVQIGSRPSAEDVAWAVLDTSLVETGLTVRQALKLMTAVMAGKISGADAATVRIRSAVADDKERITATVDGDGNRTAITVDLS